MKNRLKATAAAAAVLLAGHASAALDLPGAVPNGSELIFAFVGSNGTSYIKDLGVTFGGFDLTAAQVFDLPNFNATFSGTTGSLFQVIGSSENAVGILTTTAGNAALSFTDPLDLVPLSTALSASYPNYNAAMSGANGFLVSSNSNDLTHISKQTGFNFVGNAAFSTGFSGSASSYATGAVLQKAFLDPDTFEIVIQKSSNRFYLDAANNRLVYAPVPEPGTYALMGMGLLALGAIARRRVKS